jgi:hypothetical protein
MKAYRLGGVNPPIAPMTLTPSVFPLFIEDSEISSLVTLINSSGVSSSATLSIRSSQGITYPTVSIKILAHAKVQLKVADLLHKIGAQIRVGSILVTQGPELRKPAILGQLTLIQTTSAPMAFTEEELVMPMLVDSQDLNSISEYGTDSQLVAVTSMSNEVQHITAKCYKKDSIATRTATLPAGGQVLIYPCSKDTSVAEGASLLGISETSESAGISIHSDGPNGEFAAFGVAQHISSSTKIRFLGSLQFVDPTSLHSSSLIFSGVSVGYSLTPGAYPYSTAVALANFSSEQSQVKISFHKTGVNGTVSTTTKNVVLAPRSSLQVPLGQLNMKVTDVGSLVAAGDKNPGDLMAKIVSDSDSAPNQLEQLAKDGLDYRNGGSHPWTLQDNARSDLILFNHSAQSQPFNVLVVTEDGAQWSKQVILAPLETRTISVGDMIRNKIPDTLGRILPITAWSGTVSWYTSGVGTASGHVLVRNEASSSAESFSCGQTYVTCGAELEIDGLPFTVGGGGTGVVQADICVDYTGMWECDGPFAFTGSPFAVTGWSSDNPSVVSVINGGQDGYLSAHSPGTANIDVSIMDQYGCGADGYGTALVVPSIAGSGSNSGSPFDLWYFSGQNPSGFSTSITLSSDGGSGTTWAVTSGSNQVTLSSTSGAQITVTSSGTNFSASSNDVSITATVNGVQSSPYVLTTHKPYRLVPVDIFNNCNSNYGYVTQITYVIQDQLPSPLGADVPVNEHFPAGGYTEDYPGTTWIVGDETPGTAYNGALVDQVSGMLLSHGPWVPTPTCDDNDSTKVHHFNQEFRVGSLTTSAGTLVQTDAIQRYVGRAEHINKQSPVP